MPRRLVARCASALIGLAGGNFGQAEDPLADDVPLDLAAAAVDGLSPGQQERPLQRLEGVAVADMNRSSKPTASKKSCTR
jgi:hypothetical protein